MRIMKEIEERRKQEMASRKLAMKLSAQENGGMENSTVDRNAPLTWSRVADPAIPKRVVDPTRPKRNTPDPSITVSQQEDGWKVVEHKKHTGPRNKKGRHEETVSKQVQEEEAALTAYEDALMRNYRTQHNLALEEEIKQEARRKIERERKVSLISEKDLQLYGSNSQQDPKRFLGDVNDIMVSMNDKKVKKDIIKSVKNMVKYEEKLVQAIDSRASVEEYKEQINLMKGDTKARLESAEVYNQNFREGDIIYTNQEEARGPQIEDDILEAGRRACQYNEQKDPRNKYKQADRFPGKK